MDTTGQRPLVSLDDGQRLERARVFDGYTFNHSPLLRWGVRRIRWLHRSADPFSPYRQRVAILITALTICLWLVIYLLTRVSYRPTYLEAMLFTGLILLGVSFVGIALTDFLPVVSVARFYKPDSTHIDLMRLTLASRYSIVTAYQQLMLLDNWRTMTVMIGLRVAAVILIVGAVLVNLSENVMRYPSPFNLQDYALILMLLVFIIVVPLGLIREPRWRLRAMSAVALALAARINQDWMRLFISVLLIIGHWLLIPLYVGVLSYISTAFGSLGFYPIALPLAVYFGLRGLYHLVEKRALSYAEKHIFHQHSEA